MFTFPADGGRGEEQRAEMKSKERPPQLRDEMAFKEVSTQQGEVDSGRIKVSVLRLNNKETDSQLFLRLFYSGTELASNVRPKRAISEPSHKCCL